MSEILNSGIYPYPKNSLWLIENYEHMTIYPMNKRDLTDKETTIGIIGNVHLNQFKIVTAKDYDEFDDMLYDLDIDEGIDAYPVIVLDCEIAYDESPSYIERYLKSYFIEKKLDNDWYSFSVKDIIAIRNLFYHIYGDDIIDSVREYFATEIEEQDEQNQ